MTAGKVMAAIKVDMCRQQPTVPQIVASRPSIVDLMRRRRGNARVCLFGVPDPGATQKIYDEMLVQQHQHMLSKWQFDMKTDRFVGQDDEHLNAESSNNDPAVQLRLHGAAAESQSVHEGVAAQSDDADNRLEAQPQEEADVEAAIVKPSNSASEVSVINTESQPQPSSMMTGGGRVKCPKGQPSSRSIYNTVATKPYDKNVRPITGTKRSHSKPQFVFIILLFSFFYIEQKM